jgi:hypothetical protein
MNRIAKGTIVLLASAGFLLAESWTGKLVDANCKTAEGAVGNPNGELPANCIATTSTKSFAVQTPDGKIYKLDSAGNAKAVEIIKNNPSKNDVTVTGSMNGQMLKVDSLDLR